MKSISILDSTLRDGAQGIGISYSIEDKLKIVTLLDELGVQFIEAGNPASNPKELEFFNKAKEMKLKNSALVAFGSTRRKGVKIEEDLAIKSLLSAGTQWCTVFGKSSSLHVEKVLETTPEENVNMIMDTCNYLKKNGRHVIYDAEHFFDGFKLNKGYAIETLKAAESSGADVICLCDTNGGTFMEEMLEILEEVKSAVTLPIAVHFHDDCGVAVANSIAAVKNGAVQVQGTLLGFGERCGNANLTSIISGLQIKDDFYCIPDAALRSITQISRAVAEITNVSIAHNMPYIGKNAFAHKAGMHADGVLKLSSSYEHIDPESVGNTRRFPTSEISGKAVMLKKIKSFFPDKKIEPEDVSGLLDEIKRLEMEGYQFEGADASFELLVRKKLEPFTAFFKLIYYNINTNFIGGNSTASSTVKLEVEDQIQLMAAEGNGPVNALDSALRKALGIFYPRLSEVKLTDYKVRVLDSKKTTAARVRVLITSKYDDISFTTVGVSDDVVAASWKALEDSVEYFLLNTKN